MLDKGLTEDGAAQALGWPKARVTARVKLLELPERARELTGDGVIPLSAVELLRAIGKVSPELLEVLVDYIGSDRDQDTWVAGQLTSVCGTWMQNIALAWLVVQLAPHQKGIALATFSILRFAGLA